MVRDERGFQKIVLDHSDTRRARAPMIYFCFRRRGLRSHSKLELTANNVNGTHAS